MNEFISLFRLVNLFQILIASFFAPLNLLSSSRILSFSSLLFLFHLPVLLCDGHPLVAAAVGPKDPFRRDPDQPPPLYERGAAGDRGVPAPSRHGEHPGIPGRKRGHFRDRPPEPGRRGQLPGIQREGGQRPCFRGRSGSAHGREMRKGRGRKADPLFSAGAGAAVSG